jgi:hypothetical protein
VRHSLSVRHAILRDLAVPVVDRRRADRLVHLHRDDADLGLLHRHVAVGPSRSCCRPTRSWWPNIIGTSVLTLLFYLVFGLGLAVAFPRALILGWF